MNGINAALQMAQIENIKAQTEKTKQEATNIGAEGIDTKQKESQIAKLAAETTNEGLKGKLLEVDKTIKGVEAAVSMETLIEQVHKIKADARNAILEANDKDFTLAGKVIGKKAIYEGMQQEALSYGIKNILTRAQTKNTNQATENLKSSKLNIEEQTRVLTLTLSKLHEEIWKIDNEAQTEKTKQEATTYRDWETDRKSTRLNSSHITRSRMPSSA